MIVTSNAGFGILLIMLGMFILWRTSKIKPSPFFSIKFKGYLSGVSFIILGIIYLFTYQK